MEEYGGSSKGSKDLLPCKICGRSFFAESLQKHIPICQKAAKKKRKVFDSSRQRAEGTDISPLKPLKPKFYGASSSSKSDNPEAPKKQSNWRLTHEEFIATIRAAKSINKVLKEGGPLPPPPPPSLNPDYIQCPYCQRRFNETAAQRHINFCKEQASRIPNKAKPPARLQYKPPAVKVNSVSSVPSATTSRLPQRPVYGQTGGTGIPSTKTSAVSEQNMTTESSSHAYSSGMTSPPSGAYAKLKGSVAPSSMKNVTFGVGASKKVYNAGNCNSRDEMKTENETDSGAQGAKFCHECGSKFPMGGARFCSECGVKRMCI